MTDDEINEKIAKDPAAYGAGTVGTPAAKPRVPGCPAPSFRVMEAFVAMGNISGKDRQTQWDLCRYHDAQHDIAAKAITKAFLPHKKKLRLYMRGRMRPFYIEFDGDGWMANHVTKTVNCHMRGSISLSTCKDQERTRLTFEWSPRSAAELDRFIDRLRAAAVAFHNQVRHQQVQAEKLL